MTQYPSHKRSQHLYTMIDIVDGFHPEPPLGDNDAQSLGFIAFHIGRDPLPNEISLSGNIKRLSASILETSSSPYQAKNRYAFRMIERYQGLMITK